MISDVDLLSLEKLDHNGWLFDLECVDLWVLVCILLLVNKLSIEELGQVGANILHVHEGEGLSKAGSLANSEMDE